MSSPFSARIVSATIAAWAEFAASIGAIAAAAAPDPASLVSLLHEAAAVERQMRVFVIGVDHRLGDGGFVGWWILVMARSSIS